MKSRKMTVAQWIAVSPNPIQRNTEKHAAKAKHLSTPLAVHAAVSAAELPDGSLIKLDGHTRAYLWKANLVRHPPEVHVNIFEVTTMEEVKELYTTFDAKEALETLPEKVSGAFNELKFVPSSGLLAAGAIATALKLCWGIQHGLGGGDQRSIIRTGYTIYHAIDEFKTELFALDSFGLRSSSVPAGIVGAFVLTYRKHGPEILPFWRAVFGNAGERREGKMDAVQALNELLLVRKGKTIGFQGSAALHDFCARAVNAAERYLQGDLLVSIPRPYNLEGYIDRARPAVTLIKASQK